MTDKMFLFLFAAIAVEGIIFYVKAWAEGDLPKACVASIALGIFVAINFQLDAFANFGLQSMLPFVGSILTGILLSRGSNYFFDIVGSLSSISNMKK